MLTLSKSSFVELVSNLRDNQIEGIIFDLDGVIVDTEYHSCLRLEGFIKRYNPAVTWAELTRVVGASSEHFFILLRQLMGVGDSLADVEAALQQYMGKQAPMPPYPQIFREEMTLILEYAKDQGIALGVASSSEKAVIEAVLVSCQIAPYFDAVLTGKDFPESKPNPAIYLEMAAVLGVAPAKCVVIEDSAYGITAGKRAGMTVIAYQETRMSIDQRHADYISADMQGIFQLIKQKNQ